MSKAAAPLAEPRFPGRGHPERWFLAAIGLVLASLAWSGLASEPGRGNAPTLAVSPPRINDLAPLSAATAAEAAKIDRAKAAIASCREAFGGVSDYTCTFVKTERMEDGHLTEPHVMVMKARTRPASIYFKFRRPKPGREAIYVDGRDGGRAMVHDVGLAKLLAGTLALDPRGNMAMDDCRHPITEAGIGHMLRTIDDRWRDEMHAGETLVNFDDDAEVDGRPCTLIESIHPRKQEGFLFHRVNVYIDRELNLPIRFQAYDWPSLPGEGPILVEEYLFRDLKLNVGLTDADFDPANPAYSFGRF